MKTLAVLRKEIKIAFASPMAYFLFTIFLFVCGWMFKAIVGYVAMSIVSAFGASDMSVMETIFRPLYRNMAVILLFFAPAITMRYFAEERRMGTMELLFTYPLTDLEILAGKFLSSLVVLAFILLPTLLYPIFINHFSPVDWKVIGVQYLGFFLFGGSCMAVGLWASNLSDNQLVGYSVSFGLLLFLWTIGWGSESGATSALSRVLGQISILNHFESFSKGVLSVQDLSYYLFFILFFAYMTLKGLESRSWKGARE